MAMTAIKPQLWTAISPCNHAVTGTTLDAAGESMGMIGRLELELGASGAKTLSSAGGGSIFWRTGTVSAFANAGTNLRIGLQDPDAAGIEDGTFDVYADLVGGTDTVASTTIYQTAMESGTKTLSPGDLFAIVVEMTARGGADSVAVGSNEVGIFSRTGGGGVPYLTQDTGAGSAKVTARVMIAAILFDDGTLGWIYGAPWPQNAPGVSTLSHASNTTPDEYIGTFSLTVPVQVSGIMTYVAGVIATDDFEHILYADPYGTPTVIQAVSVEADFLTSAGAVCSLVTPVTLAAGVVYGVATRPTTTGAITFGYMDLTSGNQELKRSMLFPDCKVAARTDQTGAFVEVQTYYVPMVGIYVTGLDNGVSSGGAIVPQTLHTIEAGITA